MSWIIDILLVVLIATAGYIGYKKGIVTMLMSVLTVTLSVGLSYILSAPLARLSYGWFFEKSLSATVDAALESQTVATANAAVQSLLGPKSMLGGLAGLLGFDSATVAATAVGDSVAEIALAVKTQLIMPAMILLLQILIFILLFALFWILLGLAAAAICRLAKRSDVKGANAVFGAVVGVVIGTALAVGVCLLLNLWMNINPDGLLGISCATREQTVVYRLIHEHLLTL